MQIVIAEDLVDNTYGDYQGKELALKFPNLIENEEVRSILLDGPDNPRYREEMHYLLKSYSDGESYLDRDDDGNLLLITPDVHGQQLLESLASEGNTAASKLIDGPGWMNMERLLELLDEYVAIRDKVKETQKF